jgi:hypothetical protein
VLEHLAQNVVKDAAVLVVGDFERGIDAGGGGEILFFTLSIARANLTFLRGVKSRTVACSFLQCGLFCPHASERFRVLFRKMNK